MWRRKENQMRETKPALLPTSRHRRNAFIAGLIAAAAIIGGVVYAISTIPQGKTILSVDAIQASTPVVVKEVQEESASDDNTPEKAKEIIVSYYAAIAERDAGKLRNLGDTAAANALERGWLDDIGFIVDTSKTSSPDHDGFPTPVGLYAGCSIYRIADFYNMPSNEAIKSDITGLTSVQGWIYYNPMIASWVIVDPVMPTAVARAQADNQQKASQDGMVTTTINCPGAYSNPWWCYAKLKVTVENASLDPNSKVFIAPNNVFDRGITLQVPTELQGEVGHATEGTISTVASSDQTADGNVAQVTTTTSIPAHKEGICVVYRGTTSNFTIDRIGAKPQNIDGNICPIVVNYGDENTAPVFPIGKSNLDDMQSLLTEQQIEEYGATTDAVNIDPNYPTTFEDANAESGE